MNSLFTTTLLLLTLTPVASRISLQKELKSEPLNPLTTKFKAVAKNDGEGAAAVTADNLVAKAIGQSTSRSGAATEAVRTSFGSAVETVTVFKPFYLTGDFNGDNAQDVVVAVRITGRRSTLSKDVTVLNPWGYSKSTYPADPTAKPTLALAIIHGTNAGWQAQSAGKFLLVGDSPILILNYERTTSGPEALQDLMSIVKLGKLRPGEALPPTVKRARKGDVIVLGTEAVNSFLYWNGKTYRWEEEGED